MRLDIYELDVPTEVAEGDEHRCDDLVDKWVAIDGTFDATIAIEISLDGISWHESGSATAAAMIEVPEAAFYVRANVTAYTSGTPTAVLAGRCARVE